MEAVAAVGSSIAADAGAVLSGIASQYNVPLPVHQAAHLDHSGFANIDILRDSYRQSVKQAAGAVALAAELYLSGISIASEIADWVIIVNELAHGNLNPVVGFIPLIPAVVGKTGIVLKHGKQSLRINREVVREVKALPIDDMLALLESTRRLARNMEKAGIVRLPNTAAHHIVPANLKKFKSAEKARDIQTGFGITLESAANVSICHRSSTMR